MGFLEKSISTSSEWPIYNIYNIILFELCKKNYRGGVKLEANLDCQMTDTGLYWDIDTSES